MLSGSLTYHLTVTSLRNHPSFPEVPPKEYVMTGGVESAATEALANTTPGAAAQTVAAARSHVIGCRSAFHAIPLIGTHPQRAVCQVSTTLRPAFATVNVISND